MKGVCGSVQIDQTNPVLQTDKVYKDFHWKYHEQAPIEHVNNFRSIGLSWIERRTLENRNRTNGEELQISWK